MSENNSNLAEQSATRTTPQNSSKTVAIKFEMSNEAFSQMQDTIGKAIYSIAEALENRKKYDYEIEKAKMEYKMELMQQKMNDLKEKYDDAREKLNCISVVLEEFANTISGNSGNDNDDSDDNEPDGNNDDGNQNPEPQDESANSND